MMDNQANALYDITRIIEKMDNQANALYDIKQYVARMGERIENIEKMQTDTNEMLAIILKCLIGEEND